MDHRRDNCAACPIYLERVPDFTNRFADRICQRGDYSRRFAFSLALISGVKAVTVGPVSGVVVCADDEPALQGLLDLFI